MSSHRSPSEVRASLKHPIIDADGHWVEYTPVFAEKMRKAAGDKAADGFLTSQRRGPGAPRPSIAPRPQRRGAPEGGLGRPAAHHPPPAPALEAPPPFYSRRRERVPFRLGFTPRPG